MPALPGALIVWNDLEPGRDAAFEAWYERQHVPERLHVAGFRTARRYRAVDGGSPQFCALYRLDSVEVLASGAYRQCLARPTRATQRAMRWFRAMGRTPCDVVLELGARPGSVMTWFAAAGRDTACPAIEWWRTTLEHTMTVPGLEHVLLGVCNERLAGEDNPEQRLRSEPDAVARWIVVLEASSEQTLQPSAAELYARLGTAWDAGSGTALRRGPTYRLHSSACAGQTPQPCADDVLLAEPDPV